MFFVVEEPTPVLNTPHFSFAFGGKSGSEIPTNEKGHCLFLEFVALKGMRFFLEEKIPNSPIYRVSSPHYLAKELYIDSRFGTLTSQNKPHLPPLPSPETILSRMKQLLGKPYVWGGNWSPGIPKMLELYPSQKTIDPQTHILWTMEGVDCSGLLYEATRGATPRNTSDLLNFGTSLLNIKELQPLDMILYPGHVLFVEDEKHSIESKSPFGVIERNLLERLEEVISDHAADFAIRRIF